jgi:hypothetical protein
MRVLALLAFTVIPAFATTEFECKTGSKLDYTIECRDWYTKDSDCSFIRGGISKRQGEARVARLTIKKEYRMIYPIYNPEVYRYNPVPSQIGRIHYCIERPDGSKITLGPENAHEFIDLESIQKIQKKLNTPVIDFLIEIVAFSGLNTNWVRRYPITFIDSIASSYQHSKGINELIKISSENFGEFQELYVTPKTGNSRKQFLSKFSSRPNVDSLGFLFYDSTGYDQFVKPDSIFAGGMIINRVFINSTENWRVIKGVRYRITSDYRAQIVDEKIFLLFQRFNDEVGSCCGG